MAAAAEPKVAYAIRWVVIVVVVGVVAGAILALLLTGAPGGPPPGPGGPPLPRGGVSQAMVVLSTVNLALLLALLVVYGRTYGNTRAPFALGLWIILFALLLESSLTSPILFAAFRVGPVGGLGGLLAVGQLLMCVALLLFLYLSLQ
jgi:hypothetical protein